MSSPVLPLALAGAALFLISGKSKKSKSTSVRGISYKTPAGTKIPEIYGPAPAPPQTTDSVSDWISRQEALTALSRILFAFQGKEISICSKCDPQGVDGKPGPNTRAAVKAFQALAGLTVTGIWGIDEDRAMHRTLTAIGAGKPIPCDPLLEYPSPLACFAQEDGTFGLMPSVETESFDEDLPNPSSDPTDPPPVQSKFGPDELLVADGDCNYILHQDQEFFEVQKMLMIESALEGLTDSQAANEIHEEMMRRYIPMCLFLGRDKVGQGVRTWWDKNLGHVFNGLRSYEYLPDLLEEDAIKYGLL